MILSLQNGRAYRAWRKEQKRNNDALCRLRSIGIQKYSIDEIVLAVVHSCRVPMDQWGLVCNVLIQRSDRGTMTLQQALELYKRP